MSLGGKLLTLFPALVMALALGAIVEFVRTHNLGWIGVLFFVLYLFPPLAFRIHNLFWPLKPGVSDIQKLGYSPWWTSYQIQSIYIAVPTLEALLRVIPGVYSAWLRLWGSKIGKQVVWTPRVVILDRNFLNVGNRVVFGQGFQCSGHLIDKRKGGLTLYMNYVTIGKGSFLGAEAVMGPGCVIAEGTRLPPRSVLKMNETLKHNTAIQPSKT